MKRLGFIIAMLAPVTAFLSPVTTFLSPTVGQMPNHAPHALQAAGPKWMKQATKSLATLYALQQGGDTLRANAFFVSEGGALVAPLKPVQQAQRAWVVDAQGGRLEVSRVMGFNATYNVVRLLAETTVKKKAACLPIGTEAPGKGETVYLMPRGLAEEIAQVEKAGTYDYYTLRSEADAEVAGMPVVNEAGQVVAIAQTPILTAKAPNYALDIRLAEGLTIRPIDANHADLSHCDIPKQLPQDEAQATSFLYIASTARPELRQAYIEDFIRAFPQSVTGYVQKAEAQVNNREYDAAYATYEEGLKQTKTGRDELLYSRSRALYTAAVQQQEGKPANWTLEQAVADIEAAIEANPLPLYTVHRANILFALKRYEEAYRDYMAATQTPMRSAELFMYAWQCQQNLGAEQETLLALNDSAVACFTKPYPNEAAPYLYLRSTTLQEMGRLREAIADLNDYEHLMQGQLTAKFYYQREQLEVQTRMYGPAINDIQKAISLEPGEPAFHAELAVLFIRLNDMDNAIAECRKAAELDEQYPDAYRLWGICLREKGDKAGARQKLQKAAELGDPMAGGILEKMGD